MDTYHASKTRTLLAAGGGGYRHAARVPPLRAATIDHWQRPLLGGERMTDNPNWRVVRLDDLERRGRFIPVRESLGIHSFGINAVTLGEDGTLINEHDESGSGQEEVYVVLRGTATFEIDGQTFDAPEGTFVSVPPDSRRKASGDATVLALGGTPGEAYQALDWGEAWSIHSESMTAYGEQRYADALAAVRTGLERFPDHAGLNYNYACFATIAGEIDNETFSHLRRSVELFPPFRQQARLDDDFEAVRDDPRFAEALR
jgi:mannose-6-phosphate isomerase-like protein (cupin superfamily)